MGRPELMLGTHGRVRAYRTKSGWRAMALYRDFDGVTRQVERSAKTRSAAEQTLERALRERRHGAAEVITAESRFGVAAEKWFVDLEGLSPSTVQAYRDRLDRLVLPALANVRLREITVGLVDKHLGAIKASNGPGVAKMTKTVISGVCGMAVRHDAMASNPCRDVGRISSQPRKRPVAFTLDELRAVRSWFAEDKKANDRDLPDLVSFLAGTGARIGEACAVMWSDVNFEQNTVAIRGTVLRIKGSGLVVSRPKSRASERVVEPPVWCMEMLKRRRRDDGPVFPSPRSDGLRDPSNTRRGLREGFAAMGVTATSHTFRKTVATLMDEAGLSARSAADQLGHAKPSLTSDVYFARRSRATGAAAVLEAVDEPTS